MSRLLIVDDDREIREFMKVDLQMSGYSVDTATDGQEGLSMALKNAYDMVLLDVMMPKMDGFEVCKNIRKINKEIPILLLTAKGAIEDKIMGFETGADDYLVKPFDIQELLVRVRALLRRNKTEIQTSEITDAGDIKLLPDSLEAIVNSEIKKLTPTEFEILFCLMQHINQPVTLSTLLNEVWGYAADEDVRMLRVHVGGLRHKIEPNPKTPKYLHTITNVGYKLTPFGES